MEIADQFRISISCLDGDLLYGELLDSAGAVLWSGIGDDRAAGLLEMMTTLDAERHEVEVMPELPAPRIAIIVADVADNVRNWELRKSAGEVMLSGRGDDRADALMAILLRITTDL